MYQSFDTTADPSKGPARLERLRRAMKMKGLDGFIIPRSDAHQGEYVAKCDQRLAWLSGFTGSAGFCIALMDKAGVFIDGRYRNQVRSQVDLAHFTPVPWPEVQPGNWLSEQASAGQKIGFDPWLHSRAEIERLQKDTAAAGLALVAVDNLVDQVWSDRPARPTEPITVHPIEFAGQTSADKCTEIADELLSRGLKAQVLTLLDSIAWLLNIRGSDIAHIPVVQGFAIIGDDAQVTLFTEDGRDGLDALAGFSIRPTRAFGPALEALDGPVGIDKGSAPFAVAQHLDAGGVAYDWNADPIVLPKARKNPTELAGARKAHLRDAAAMVEFLSWFDASDKTSLTEVDLVENLEEKRQETGRLEDISFETISGAGPNGAIIHYRVTHDTNRRLADGDLVVLDSGGQYRDGTTDITRTLVVGDAGEDEKRCFTRVLQGMIALSRTYFPRGRSGRDLDPIARYPLWAAHQDYNHGTGHGVGAFLSVHEGPQRFSHISEVALEPGMILSNEPGYYRDGAFGIRIENLVVVAEATCPAGGDSERALYRLETLTYVPIDTRLVIADMLSGEERTWLNTYHATCREKLSPLLTDVAYRWLQDASAPI